MFEKIFKPKATDFIAPFRGKMMQLEEVPDPTFSQKTIGDGFALEMYDGNVYSPVDGKIIAVFPTGHAIGIKADDRNEYLIHLGLNTLQVPDKVFNTKVTIGQTVKKGELLSIVDLDFFRSQQNVMICPIIVMNSNQRKIKLLKQGEVEAMENGIIAIIP